MPNYTTGEMAKLCDVSVRTVQFYDTKGILHPSDLSEGGRRIYGEEDLGKLRLICMLKTIGLSLSSIKSVLKSELSGKILTVLLDEQDHLLADEIKEKLKRKEMIRIMKENIREKAIVPVNTILGIEDVMEKKNRDRNTIKLALIYTVVGVVAASQLLLLAWLIASHLWWALVVYGLTALTGILMTLFQLKDTEFVCPRCGSVFVPSRKQAFFSTGDHKVRWTTCPACGHKEWCVLRKRKRMVEVGS